MSKVYNPKTRRMVLRSGKTGKTIVKTISNDKPLYELPDDVIHTILEMPTLVTYVSKVAKEWHLQHEKRMITAKKCFEWIYSYMIDTVYFAKETFNLVSKSNTTIQILINSFPNKKCKNKYEFKINNKTVFKFVKEVDDIKKNGNKLREILPQYLSELLNETLLSIVSIDLDISQQVEKNYGIRNWYSSQKYIAISKYDMKHISESKKLKMEI
jgi:hypothetical protein